MVRIMTMRQVFPEWDVGRARVEHCPRQPKNTLLAKVLAVSSSEKTHHWVHVLLARNNALHDDRLVVIVLEELLHLRRQILCTGAPDGVDAHSLGEQHKVGVGHLCVRVPLLVE